jgi:hypothetical protein
MKYLLVFITIASFTACNNHKENTGSNTIITNNVDTSAKVLIGRTIVPADVEPQKPVAENRLIIPGKSIGLTAINDKADSVFKKLGKPDEGDAAMGKSIQTWYSKSETDTTKYSTTIYFTTNMGGPDEATRAKQIRVTSPFFMTAERIGVNSVLESVSHYFPLAIKTAVYKDAAKKPVYIYDDTKAGIAFEINDQNKCVGITIHPENAKAFQTYIAFFDGIKML